MAYSPTLGRWAKQDPAGYVDGQNQYQFVNANPANRVDPLGLWDAAGHFYTTYMVAIAVGKTPKEAYELAYFSQLPDQVTDYDATEAGEVLVSIAQIRAGGFALDPKYAAYLAVEKAWALDVQKVLHSLHGGDAGIRQSCLEKLLSSGKLTQQEAGLIIHPFGDSVAHTYNGGKKAYGPPLGHLIRGHTPDIIGKNVPKYHLYIHDLYRTLGGNPATESANPQMRALRNFTNGFVGNSDAAWQIKMMRRLSQTPMFGYSNTYAPENGGTDPQFGSLTRKELQSVIDKIKAACGC